MMDKAFPFLLAAFMVLLQLGGELSFNLLSYNRSEILQGEIWRLISCHFIHMGWPHLAMNLMGFAFIWFIAEKLLSIKEIILSIVFSGLLISLGLLILEPEIMWYIGSSGILHGFLVAAAIAGMQAKYWEAYALFIFLVVKLCWEQILGPLPSSTAIAGVKIIVDAHLYGALGGLLSTVLSQRKK